MEKRFLIVNRGKDKYGLTHSQLSEGELISVNRNIHTLRNITDVGRETNNIILRNISIFNTGDGFNDYVTDLEYLNDGGVIVIGAFTEYNGTPFNNIIKLKPDGSIDNNFQIGTGLSGLLAFSGINHFLFDPSDEGFWLVGSFTSYNGIAANGVIKLDQNGNKINTFNYGTGFQASFRVYGIMADTLSSSVFFHGIFTSYNGTGANFITKLLPNGSFDTSFVYGSGFNNAVTNLKVNADGSIICAGYFTTYKGASITRLIKIDRYGDRISTFVPGSSFNNPVIYLNKDNSNSLFAYGYFTSYKGTVVNRIVKIDIDTGDIDPSFNIGTGFDAPPITLFLNDDGSLYVGGEFTTYNTDPVSRIVKLNPDGSIDPSFNTGTGFDAGVYYIGVKDGRITATGDFSTYNGGVANNIIILNPDGSRYEGSEFTFLDGRAEYNIVDLDNTTDNEILPKHLIEDLIYDNKVISLSKSDVDTLIDNNNLKIGSIYNITDADVNLYGGSSIFLKAITNNRLSIDGDGIFYTPKYTNSSNPFDNLNYGVWTKYMSGTFSTTNGTFSLNEYVNGNNGSVGRFLGIGFLEWVSGTWSSTSVITGSSSLATASIIGFTSPSYATSSIVHWGGKSWRSVNGSVGSSIDKYGLTSSSWTVIPFNNAEYNVNVDKIKYDYDNDMIIYRSDKNGNEVSGSTYSFTAFLSNPIKDFQWGNGIKKLTYYDEIDEADVYVFYGVQQNTLIDSYFDCINNISKFLYKNNINNGQIRQNTMDKYSTLLNNTLLNSSIYSNVLSRGNVELNILNNCDSNGMVGNSINYSTIYKNLIVNNSIVSSNNMLEGSIVSNSLDTNSVINNNIIKNSDIQLNSLDAGSSISLNSLKNTSSLRQNKLNSNAFIVSNTLDDVEIRLNNLSNSTNLKFVNIPSGVIITKLLSNGFNFQNVTPLDVSTASILFNIHTSKNLFDRPDGVARLSYYNSSDAFIIGPIYI